jgi:hypothetical protein
VLQGADDPKRDMCKALRACDSDAFQGALGTVGRNRRDLLEQREAEGTLDAEFALLMKPIWPEGLGLLRLAELAGIGSVCDCPNVPPQIRVAPPFCYESDAWRDLDFKPQPL